MPSKVALLGLFTLFATGAVGAVTRVTGSALLDMHSIQVYEYGVPLGVLYVSRDWTVATDGTTGSIVRLRPITVPAQPYAAIKELVADPQAFADLSAALLAGKAGTVAGNCSVGVPPPAGQFYRYEITWYGVHGRIHRFLIGNDFADPCPAEVSNLLGAILTFEQRVIDEPLPVW